MRELLHHLLDRSTAVGNPESTANPIRDHIQRLTAIRDFTGDIEITAADPLWFGPMPQRINDALNVTRELDHAGSLLSNRNVGPPQRGSRWKRDSQRSCGANRGRSGLHCVFILQERPNERIVARWMLAREMQKVRSECFTAVVTANLESIETRP